MSDQRLNSTCCLLAFAMAPIWLLGRVYALGLFSTNRRKALPSLVLRGIHGFKKR
jgi:hypothetical protein